MPPPSWTGSGTLSRMRSTRPRVDRAARERAIEIDDVEIFEPFGLEPERLGGGIAVEDGDARHVALFKAHAYAVLEIDGGKEDQWLNPSAFVAAPHRCQGFQLRKLPIKASPSFWLFSGWNWVPA